MRNCGPKLNAPMHSSGARSVEIAMIMRLGMVGTTNDHVNDLASIKNSKGPKNALVDYISHHILYSSLYLLLPL
jgi:hypothetical protein